MSPSPAYKGMITAAVMILIGLVSFYVLKWQPNTKEQTLMLGAMIAGLVWSLVAYHNEKRPENKFKDYFNIGFRTFIVITLLMTVYTIVFYMSNTQIRDQFIAENSVLLAKQGNKTPQEIAEQSAQLKKLFLPMATGMTVFKYLIIGVLISVVGAGFLQQKAQERSTRPQ